jgi:hypothetical protein
MKMLRLQPKRLSKNEITAIIAEPSPEVTSRTPCVGFNLASACGVRRLGCSASEHHQQELELKHEPPSLISVKSPLLRQELLKERVSQEQSQKERRSRNW